jgi:hypothetical protein
MKTKLALLCGVPPTCDRCAEDDAKVFITLPTYGERCLCEKCITNLVEKGLTSGKDSKP